MKGKLLFCFMLSVFLLLASNCRSYGETIKPNDESKKVLLLLGDTNIEDFIKLINKLGNVEILVAPNVECTISIFDEDTWSNLLKKVIDQNNLVLVKLQNQYVIKYRKQFSLNSIEQIQGNVLCDVFLDDGFKCLGCYSSITDNKRLHLQRPGWEKYLDFEKVTLVKNCKNIVGDYNQYLISGNNWGRDLDEEDYHNDNLFHGINRTSAPSNGEISADNYTYDQLLKLDFKTLNKLHKDTYRKIEPLQDEMIKIHMAEDFSFRRESQHFKQMEATIKKLSKFLDHISRAMTFYRGMKARRRLDNNEWSSPSDLDSLIKDKAEMDMLEYN